MKPFFESFRSGRTAERRAARFLVETGHRIIERNVRVGGGEIDIISVIDRTVVFFEVRFRTGGTFDALCSVDDRKSRLVLGAIAAYRTAERLWGVPCRGDVLALTRRAGHFEIQHLVGFLDV